MRCGYRLLLFIAALLLTSLTATPTANAAVRYRLVDLGMNFDFFDAGTPINRHGEVTGLITVRENDSYQPEPFSWQHGILTPLPCFGYPSALNDDGVIVGLFGGENGTGFIVEDGVCRSVPSLPGASNQSDPWTINNSGEIWGISYVGDNSQSVLWRFRNGRMRGFGTVVPGASDLAGRPFSPRRGVVGGSVSYPDGSSSGFIWDHGQLQVLGRPTGSTRASATDMNRDLIAVGVSFTHGGFSAIRYALTGEARYLPRLGPAGASEATAINDHRLIVGDDNGEAVIWKHGRVIDLNRITRMGAGWHLDGCIDVNRHGAITAYATDIASHHFVLLKPVR
jgi:hypothetical protein